MSKNKIPKTIHYCWFGRKEKPDIVKRCISSWKTVLQDYEIIEWNESNFDINSNNYTRQAYESGKFAFVSDYVRVYALYNYGGIYLDTDVEVFRSFDDLLDNESLWGFEQENYIATSTIGSAKENKVIGEFLSLYKDRDFFRPDGSFDELTNVAMVTKMLNQNGLILNGEYQEIEDATFYPQSYFSPYDYINCRHLNNEDTYCMHYFYKSWLPKSTRIKGRIKIILSKIIGGDNIRKIRSILKS